MKLMMWTAVMAAVSGMAMGQESESRDPDIRAAQQAKMRASVSNMVAKTQAVALEREAWRQSNAVRFGTNWQVVVYGEPGTNAAAEKLPCITYKLNVNFFERHPEEVAKGVTRERVIAGARRGAAEHGKTPEESSLWVRAFDFAITNGYKGTLTNGNAIEEVYSSDPRVRVKGNRIAVNPDEQ